MNRRAAWVLSAMAVLILAIAVLTVGGSAGQFGFSDGDNGAQPATAQEQSDSSVDVIGSATSYEDDDDRYEDDDDDDEDDREHDDDDEHEGDHERDEHEEDDD